MSLVFFAVIISVLLYIDYKNAKSLVEPFGLIAIPYLIIIVVNNIFAVKLGFYKVSDKVIRMLLIALIMFFIGSRYIYIKRNLANETQEDIDNKIKNKFASIKIKNYLIYTIVFEILISIRLIMIVFKNGIGWLSDDTNEGYLMTGLLGHFLLSFYIVLPIILLYWLNNKKQIIYLVVTIIGVILLFSTFIKYHCIGIIVLMFLFVVSENKKYLKNGTIIMLFGVCCVFVANYVITFYMRKGLDDVDSTFYINHFWKYTAGSIINGNNIFTNGIFVKYNLFQKIGMCIFPLINMFMEKFFKFSFISKPSLKMMAVSKYGEYSNVIDFIGFMYPSKSGFIDFLAFACFMLFFGFICGMIFYFGKRNKKKFCMGTWIFLTFFCFLSFFSVYASLTNPWELLVMSYILPILLNKV